MKRRWHYIKEFVREPKIAVALIAVAGLVYLLSPIDLLPDAVPILGFLDDIAILAFLFFRVRDRLTALPVIKRATGQRKYSHARPRMALPISDPYQILGLSRPASVRQIRQAYRRLVWRYHPDKVGSFDNRAQTQAHERMVTIRQAYDQLMGVPI